MGSVMAFTHMKLNLKNPFVQNTYIDPKSFVNSGQKKKSVKVTILLHVVGFYLL